MSTWWEGTYKLNWMLTQFYKLYYSVLRAQQCQALKSKNMYLPSSNNNKVSYKLFVYIYIYIMWASTNIK